MALYARRGMTFHAFGYRGGDRGKLRAIVYFCHLVFSSAVKTLRSVRLRLVVKGLEKGIAGPSNDSHPDRSLVQ